MMMSQCIRGLSSPHLRKQLIQVRSVAIFNTRRKIQQRARTLNLADHTQYDYIKDNIAEILADRVTDINREFPVILDLGCGKGHIYKHLNQYITPHLIECDTCKELLELPRQPTEFRREEVLLAEEDTLPFEDNSVDMVISNLWMHWVNDLPKLFREVERVLVPDGVFLGSMFASDTIYQLRVSLQQAELERTGGISSHVSPFVTAQDIGGLLNAAKFCMLTIDGEDVTVGYPDLYFILKELQGMGESGSLTSNPTVIRRDVLTGAAAIYHALYHTSDDGDGSNNTTSTALPLTFNVLYFIGWKRSSVQGVPKPRGSQNASFQDMDMIMNPGSGDDRGSPTTK